jgi:MYXO-CTERM domain-containing protein
MALLAYSIRRAVGALLVVYVVIWVTQFAVYHITVSTECNAPRGCVPTAIERNLLPWLRIQPQLTDEWTNAGVQVAFGVLAALGAGAAWRARKRRTE